MFIQILIENITLYVKTTLMKCWYTAAHNLSFSHSPVSLAILSLRIRLSRNKLMYSQLYCFSCFNIVLFVSENLSFFQNSWRVKLYFSLKEWKACTLPFVTLEIYKWKLCFKNVWKVICFKWIAKWWIEYL